MKYSCIACGKQLKGEYCSHCGQKVNDYFSFPKLIIESIRGFGLNNALLFTIFALLKNPGKLILHYTHGKTLPYLNPIVFYIITSVADLIALEIINSEYVEAQRLYVWILIPTAFIYAFCQKIVFVKSPQNFAEHLVIATYLFGMVNLFNLIINIIPVDFIKELEPFLVLVYLYYYTFCVFPRKKWRLVFSVVFFSFMLMISLFLIIFAISFLFPNSFGSGIMLDLVYEVRKFGLHICSQIGDLILPVLREFF